MSRTILQPCIWMNQQWYDMAVLECEALGVDIDEYLSRYLDTAYRSNQFIGCANNEPQCNRGEK